MIEISEQQEAAIEDIKIRLSEEHRVPAQEALTDSLKLGGLTVEHRTAKYRYIASWKLHTHSGGVWLATVYVAVEEAHATCPAFTSDLVADGD